jgi:peroxiredoxin
MNKILLTALTLAATLRILHAAPEIGAPAPGFTLPDIKGASHSLADYKGKFVVLEWVNHGCPFVKKHYDSDNMQTLQREYTGKGVAWLSICSSAPGKQGHMSADEWSRTVERQKSAATAVLLDADGKTGRAYDAKTTPHMFIINPEGKLIYAGGIDDKATTNKEDIATARNHVSAALREAMDGKPVTMAESRPYGCSVKY